MVYGQTAHNEAVGKVNSLKKRELKHTFFELSMLFLSKNPGVFSEKL